MGGIIAASFFKGSIYMQNCHNDGNITSKYSYVGGLIGKQAASESSLNMKSCYNTGDVMYVGEDRNYYGEKIGGLIGYNYVTATIESGYNTGSIKGGKNVGGIIGCSDDSRCAVSLYNSYNSGTIQGYQYEGGLAGLLSYRYNK